MATLQHSATRNTNTTPTVPTSAQFRHLYIPHNCSPPVPTYLQIAFTNCFYSNRLRRQLHLRLQLHNASLTKRRHSHPIHCCITVPPLLHHFPYLLAIHDIPKHGVTTTYLNMVSLQHGIFIRRCHYDTIYLLLPYLLLAQFASTFFLSRFPIGLRPFARLLRHARWSSDGSSDCMRVAASSSIFCLSQCDCLLKNLKIHSQNVSHTF